MQEWNANSSQISKIAVDKEKAKSLLQVISLREKNIDTMKSEEFSTLIVEAYYEIIKELMTAVMSIDGWKTVSHEMLIGYLKNFYKEFPVSEIYMIDQLRKARNDIAYRGISIKPEYLTRNREPILKIIAKLKSVVQSKLK